MYCQPRDSPNHAGARAHTDPSSHALNQTYRHTPPLLASRIPDFRTHRHTGTDSGSIHSHTRSLPHFHWMLKLGRLASACSYVFKATLNRKWYERTNMNAEIGSCSYSSVYLGHEYKLFAETLSTGFYTRNECKYFVYHLTLEIVGLERGPLSLVSTTDELLDKKVAAPV
jgi:hypothetical protein